MITANQLRLLAPNLEQGRAVTLAQQLTESCRRYNVTIAQFRPFLANVLHESGGFRILRENMNYTTAERIVAIWPSRFTLQSAQPFVKQPRLLANQVYNGRMGNRNGTDDGFNFRGGGFAQITGRDAYQRYQQHHNSTQGRMLTIEQVANEVQTIDWVAIDSAFWFFAIWKNLRPFAHDFNTMVRRWNGGTIGMADRLSKLQQVNRILA